MRGARKLRDENATTSVIMCSPFVNIIIYTTPCFVKTVLRKLMPYTLISHTDAHAVRFYFILHIVQLSAGHLIKRPDHLAI